MGLMDSLWDSNQKSVDDIEAKVLSSEIEWIWFMPDQGNYLEMIQSNDSEFHSDPNEVVMEEEDLKDSMQMQKHGQVAEPPS